MNARFFGESPQLTFNGATALVSLSNGGGYATIDILEDTIFSSLVFAHPIAGSASLVGKTFPAGKVIYGVRSFQVTSGAGVAYLSVAPNP